MKPICPHCGYDLQADQPILINDFSMMSSLAPLFWKDQLIKLTSSESQLCWALMKAYPDPVRHETILERLDSDATANVVDVFVCRIRAKLREMGAPNPIASTRHRGQSRACVWRPGGKHVVRGKTAKQA